MVARQQQDLPQDKSGAAPGPLPEQESLSRMVLAVVADVRAVSGAWMDLVATETRTVVRTGLTVLAMAVGAGIAAVSAWLFLIGAAVALAIGLGTPPWLALLVAALLHVLAAAVVILIIRRLSRSLTFPVTRAAVQERTGDAERSASKA